MLIICKVNSQNATYFELKNNAKKQVVNFQQHSNLIIFPIKVNNKELNFILDSGVTSTILFNINTQDSVPLFNTQKIKLRGLGSEEPVDAILSKNNLFSLKNMLGINQNVYVIFDDSFDLSSRVGMTIHGIIGYELLKNFVVTINYNSKKLTFYSLNGYKEKICKKCEVFNLELHQSKPYINIGAKFTENEITPVKLLIDTGGSDALWFFENSHPNIKPPTNFFRDYLGEGLSGKIYGKRSYINGLVLGKYELKRPTVSFPDSIAIATATQFTERNGSVGGNILKRFTVTLNYPQNKVIFKKNSKFKEPFRYNMSGLELVYNGKLLVKESKSATFDFKSSDGSGKNSVSFAYDYKYSFKPSYKIFSVREGSPADKAGLLPNDIVIKINGKYSHDMKLEELMHYFFQKENKRITLLIERNGVNHIYKFKLEDRI